MADNTTLNSGTGGDTIATDDVNGVKYQRIKVTVGGDGTTLGDVSAANPFPVVNSAAVTVTGSVGVSGPVTVQGSVGIAGPVTVQGSVGIAGPVTVQGTVAATQSGSWGIAGPVTVQGSVGIAGPVTVTGAVAIANLLGSTVVSGATVVGAIGIAKRVDTQATVTSAVSTATPLHVNEFGSLWVVAEAGDSQRTNGGGVTGVQVFIGDGTTVGTVSLAAGTNTNEVVGDAAHGAAVAGNPVLIGVEGRSTDQTAVDSGDVSRLLATLLGKPVNQPYAIPAQYTSFANVTAGLGTTTASTAWASAGAGTRWYVTSAQIVNQGAVTTRVLIQDGAGALYYNISAASNGGGVAAAFPVPLRIAANQTVEIKLDTTGTTVFTNLQGYKAAE